MNLPKLLDFVNNNKWVPPYFPKYPEEIYKINSAIISQFFLENKIIEQNGIGYNNKLFNIKIEGNSNLNKKIDQDRVLKEIIKIQILNIKPLIEIKFISESKGFGVFALIDYPIFTVFGFYAGNLVPFSLIRKEDTYDGYFEFNKVYTDGVNKNNYPNEVEYSKTNQIIIDNRNGRNWLYFINGVFSKEEEKYINLIPVEYFIDNFPFIFFVSIKEIKKGDELIYNYGNNYKKNKLGFSNEYKIFFKDLIANEKQNRNKHLKNKEEITTLIDDVENKLDNLNLNDSEFEKPIEFNSNYNLNNLNLNSEFKNFSDKKIESQKQKENYNMNQIENSNLKKSNIFGISKIQKEKPIKKEIKKNNKNEEQIRKKELQENKKLEKQKLIAEKKAQKELEKMEKEKAKKAKELERIEKRNNKKFEKKKKEIYKNNNITKENIFKIEKNINNKSNVNISQMQDINNIAQNNVFKPENQNLNLKNLEVQKMEEEKNGEEEDEYEEDEDQNMVEEEDRPENKKTNNLIYLNKVDLKLTKSNLIDVAESFTTTLLDLLIDYKHSFVTLFQYNIAEEKAKYPNKSDEYFKNQYNKSILTEPSLLSKDQIKPILENPEYSVNLEIIKNLKSYLTSLEREEDLPPIVTTIGKNIKDYKLTFATTIFENTLIGFFGGQIKYIYPNINKPFITIGSINNNLVIIDGSFFANYTILFRQANFDNNNFELLEQPNLKIKIIVDNKTKDLFITIWSAKDINPNEELIIDWGLNFRKAITFFKSIKIESVEEKMAKAVPVQIKRKKDGVVLQNNIENKVLAQPNISADLTSDLDNVQTTINKLTSQQKERDLLYQEQGFLRGYKLQQEKQRELEKKIEEEIKMEEEAKKEDSKNNNEVNIKNVSKVDKKNNKIIIDTFDSYDLIKVESFLSEFTVTSIGHCYVKLKIKYKKQIDFDEIEKKNLLEPNYNYDLILEDKLYDEFKRAKTSELNQNFPPLYCEYNNILNQSKMFALKKFETKTLIGEFVGKESTIANIRPNEVFYKLNNLVALVKDDFYNFTGLATFDKNIKNCNCIGVVGLMNKKYPRVLIITLREIKTGEEIIINY